MPKPAAPTPTPRHRLPDWDALGVRQEEERRRHKAAGDAANAAGRLAKKAALELQLGRTTDAKAATEQARKALDGAGEDGFNQETKQRAYALKPIAEQIQTVESTLHFLEMGRFPPPSEGLDDSEYIQGLLGGAENLAKYAVGRATAGDASSIAVCRDGVKALQGALLAFDFRNGPLRRRFDGLKYQVKRLEDLLYEQSLIGKTISDVAQADEDDPCLKALAEIKVRFDEADQARENVIKKSRDVQKASKQAIFACHRGDAAKASKLLETAKTAAEAILNDESLVKKWPALRFGSLAAALEEYAEAALFMKWLEAKKDPSAPLVASQHALGLPLSDEEYLGGVCDLTGEVGRVAVAAATARDLGTVRRVFETDVAVMEAVSGLNLPPKLAKKIGPLETCVRKVEHLLYELALAAANPLAAKRAASSAGEEPEAKKARADDEE